MLLFCGARFVSRVCMISMGCSPFRHRCSLACHNVGACYNNGLHVRMSYTWISPKLSEIDIWLLKTGLPDSVSAVRFVIGSMVVPFWAFLGWHFAQSVRNGLVRLVNVVNGSVGTVASRNRIGHRGRPAVVTSHNGRYLVSECCPSLTWCLAQCILCHCLLNPALSCIAITATSIFLQLNMKLPVYTMIYSPYLFRCLSCPLTSDALWYSLFYLFLALSSLCPKFQTSPVSSYLVRIIFFP